MSIPYAVRISFGNSPWSDVTADGKLLVAQPGAIVPVRVGVPPLTPARDECCVTSSRTPAIVSTLPLMPDGAFGVLTGSATDSFGCPVA